MKQWNHQENIITKEKSKGFDKKQWILLRNKIC